MFKEFKEFALKGSVVDMAVGIIIGAAFGAVVSSFVSDVLHAAPRPCSWATSISRTSTWSSPPESPPAPMRPWPRPRRPAR